MKTVMHRLVICLLVSPLLALPAVAQDAPEIPAPSKQQGAPLSLEDQQWRFRSIGWLWAMGLEGTLGARGASVSVDASFADVLDATDSLIGIAGRLEIGKGRWGGFIDGLYNRLGVEDATGPLGLAEVDVTMEQAIIDFGVLFRLTEMEIEALDGTSGRLSLDLYAGGRYSSLDIEIDPEVAATREGGRDWIDPIIGASVAMPIANHVNLEARGDVGGFGAASDFTWSAMLLLVYEFELFDLPASVFGGYRAIGQDYSDGSGSDRFEWDVTLHGPTLGFSLAF